MDAKVVQCPWNLFDIERRRGCNVTIPDVPEKSNPVLIEETRMTHLCARGRFIPLFAVAFCLVLSGCSGKGKPTKANFDKIKKDMTDKEVEALMGPPAETVDLKAVADLVPDMPKVPGMPDVGGMAKGMMAVKQMVWKDGDTLFHVTFNKENKVILMVSGKESDLKKSK
jgi:hypothetical protein